jgi:hypothetical protein
LKLEVHLSFIRLDLNKDITRMNRIARFLLPCPNIASSELKGQRRLYGAPSEYCGEHFEDVVQSKTDIK